MSPATHTFRVVLEERATWAIMVEALDAEAAEEIALDQLTHKGLEQFTLGDVAIKPVLSHEVAS
jgi:hypothetical protein